MTAPEIQGAYARPVISADPRVAGIILTLIQEGGARVEFKLGATALLMLEVSLRPSLEAVLSGMPDIVGKIDWTTEGLGE